MSKVYVTQIPAYYDREKRGWVNKYDLSPAEKFGEVIALLRPGNIFRRDLEKTVRSIEREMMGFTKDDYVLALGDPIAIGLAVMAASRATGGRVTILKFDRKDGEYHPFPIRLNDG